MNNNNNNNNKIHITNTFGADSNTQNLCLLQDVHYLVSGAGIANIWCRYFQAELRDTLRVDISPL
jgi:hypothetical protein